MEQCQHQLSANPGFTVAFARRKSNEVAHILARNAIGHVFISVPYCIRHLIDLEMI